MTTTAGGRPGAAPAAPETVQRPRPVLTLAVLGALLLAFELYVLARWVTGPDFRPTLPGPDPLPAWTGFFLTFMQIATPIGAAVCLWFWIVRPWRREGRLTTDGMFALAAGMIFFWDMCMNYTSITLFYNSHLMNFGAWANGAWPGWTAPGGNLLPEPILIVVPAYTCLVFSQVMFMLWLLRRAKARWPDMGWVRTIAVIVVGLTITDTIVESTVLRMGVYAYPGGIRGLTLFAGQTYQMPMTETFFFGGLGFGSIAVFMHFRDDKGRTVLERGLERVRVSARQKQLIKFLAVFGAVHGAFVILYMVPCQWLATHSDPYPAGYPSYLTNGMCRSGADGTTCPGPGIVMPRPAQNKIFAMNGEGPAESGG
jgi:hypothetical protein